MLLFMNKAKRHSCLWYNGHIIELGLATLEVIVEVDHEGNATFFLVVGAKTPVDMSLETLLGAIFVKTKLLVDSEHLAVL